MALPAEIICQSSKQSYYCAAIVYPRSWKYPDQAAFRTYSDQAGRFAFGCSTAARYDIRISQRGYSRAETKQLLIPRENGVSIIATVLQSHQIVVCQ